MRSPTSGHRGIQQVLIGHGSSSSASPAEPASTGPSRVLVLDRRELLLVLVPATPEETTSSTSPITATAAPPAEA